MDKALARLRYGRRVAWTGKGRRGNPYRYAALGTLPAEGPDTAADGGAKARVWAPLRRGGGR